MQIAVLGIDLGRDSCSALKSGHTVRLMSPEYLRPLRQGQKMTIEMPKQLPRRRRAPNAVVELNEVHPVSTGHRP